MRIRQKISLIGVVAIIVAGLLTAFAKMNPSEKDTPAKPQISSSLPFDLNQPDLKLEMPSQLVEISGVTVNDTGELAWAVNDEKGVIYKIQLSDGSVSKEHKFAPVGDYEGILRLGENFVVTRSDGQLFSVSKNGTAKQIKSPLTSANDVEGLALQTDPSRILVACKDKAGKGKKYNKTKAIYAVEPNSWKWKKKPAYLISQEALKDWLKKAKKTGLKKSRAKAFAPSALAIDPLSKNIYVASSPGQMLVVLSPSGQILAAAHLDRKVHIQPEGMDFDAKGSLYIANEGRVGKAQLFRFDRKL